MKTVHLIILLLLCSSSSIYSCSCIGKSKLKIATLQTDAILTGKIISKEIFEIRLDSFSQLTISQAKYQVLISERLKGSIYRDTIEIITGIGNGDCGVKFNTGEKYLLYLTFKDEIIRGEKVPYYLTTNVCTRTKMYDEREVIKIRKILKRMGFS